jgi:hypothetical protein
MTLSPALSDREYQKFEDVDGETTVRVTQKGTSTVQWSGLRIGGKMTLVTLNASTWTALPPTPLANRNAVGVQNQSATDIKFNYDNTEPGFVGILVKNNGERYYDITDNVIIYAKAASGTPTILVEEIA